MRVQAINDNIGFGKVKISRLPKDSKLGMIFEREKDTILDLGKDYDIKISSRMEPDLNAKGQPYRRVLDVHASKLKTTAVRKILRAMFSDNGYERVYEKNCESILTYVKRAIISIDSNALFDKRFLNPPLELLTQKHE